MADIKRLQEIIVNKGLSKTFIAQKMGISRQALYNKLNGLAPFNQYDIKKLCDILDIKNSTEMKRIFFN